MIGDTILVENCVTFVELKYLVFDSKNQPLQLNSREV